MTIEVYETDITDGLNRELYDKLKAENGELLKKIDELEEELDTHAEAELQMMKQHFQLEKKLDIAVRGLWFIYYQSDVKDMYDCAEGTLKQLGELDK